MEVQSAGAPGAPRCSEAATGQVAELKDQLLHLCNDLWDVHALLGATMARITDLEMHGEGQESIGTDAACTVRRLVSLARDTLGQLASTGRARERQQ